MNLVIQTFYRYSLYYGFKFNNIMYLNINHLDQELINATKYRQYNDFFVDTCDLHYISMGFPCYIASAKRLRKNFEVNWC